MCARKIPLDYRRHLEMQVSDCLVTYIFPSTSTLLNPMRHSSQNFVGRVALCEKQDFESIMSRIRSHAELFFAHFVSILVLFVSVIRWHVGQSREMAELFFATFPNPFRDPFLGRFCGTQTQTNKLIAPYRENYVHQILIFFVRNSFWIYDQGPAGPDPDGPDGAGPNMVGRHNLSKS